MKVETEARGEYRDVVKGQLTLDIGTLKALTAQERATFLQRTIDGFAAAIEAEVEKHCSPPSTGSEQ